MRMECDLWEQGEYRYPMAFGFEPYIAAFIHDDEVERPGIVIVPGGGYRVVSPSEGEIVAREFYEKGYQAFICTYTTNLLGLAPLLKQPMCDLARAVRLIRKYSEKFHVLQNALVLCGFSAGAHLCGSLCTHFGDMEEENPRFSGISCRPDAAVLSYPVITAGTYAHEDSFTALLGEGASTEDREYMSLEKQVKSDTPPCFLWQTATDEFVPVENSYLMAEALKKKGIPFAHHVFSSGKHGLSLANEAWARGDYGKTDTMRQTSGVVKAIKNGELAIPESGRQKILDAFDYNEQSGRELLRGNIPNDEAAIWPLLADTWVKAVLKNL